MNEIWARETVLMLHLYPGVDKTGKEHFVVAEASGEDQEWIFDVISVSCWCRPTRGDVE